MSSFNRPPMRQREQKIEEATAPPLERVSYPSTFVISPSLVETSIERAFAECEKSGTCPRKGWTVSYESLSPGKNKYDGVSEILSLLFDKEINVEQVTNKPVLGSPYQCVSAGIENLACKYSVINDRVVTVPGDMVKFTPSDRAGVRTRMLTRSDIFPPTVPLYEVEFTNVAVYSSTPVETNAQMVRRINEKASIASLRSINFFDGTACVGGDTINTMYNWELINPGKRINIEACEFDRTNFLCLEENVRLFGYSERATLHNADTTSLLLPKRKLTNSPHVIFFDPPWGGKDYKKESSVRLTLGKYEIFDLAKILSSDEVQYPNLRLVVIKAPYNMEVSEARKEMENSGCSSGLTFGTGSSSKNIFYHFVDVEKWRSLSLNNDDEIDRPASPIYAPPEDLTLDEYLNSLAESEWPLDRLPDLKVEENTTRADYETALVDGSFKIPSSSWVTLEFSPHVVPVVDTVGNIPVQNGSYLRLYFFAERLGYSKAVLCLVRFLWNFGHSARLSFMTEQLSDKETTKINVVVVDMENASHSSLKKDLSSILSMREHESFIDLLDTNKTRPSLRLHKFNVYDSVYDLIIESEGSTKWVPIVSYVELPSIKLGEPMTLLPSDRKLKEFTNNQNIGSLLLPKIINKKREHRDRKSLPKELGPKKSIVEKELARKELYEKIRETVVSIGLADNSGHKLNLKENNNLVLRFLFNKIATKNSKDDPVFISTESVIAKRQLLDDFSYHKIANYKAGDFYELLQEQFSSASKQLEKYKPEQDSEIKVEQGMIFYKDIKFPDVGNLAAKNPENASNALALNIRYTYMRLLTHGLANDYASMGYYPEDDVREGFANAFNHYFVKWHSAFPDLESVYGSLGSFFEASEFTEKTIMCNPPFDLSVMLRTIEVVKIHLERAKKQGKSQKFILTFPAWKDVPEFNDLKDHPMQVEYRIIPKNETRFIDYMNGKIIKPCDILQVTLETE